MKGIVFSIFVCLTSTAVVAQKVIDKVVAVVGDKAILLSDIEGQKLQALQQGVEVNEETEGLILEELMFEKLLLHQAEIDSVEVTDDEVNRELDQRIQYYASQMPNGIEGLEEFYGKTIGEIKDEFFEQIQGRMRAEKMRGEITAGVTASPKNVRDFFNSFPEDSIPFINSKISVAQLTIQPEVGKEEKVEIKKKLEEYREQIIGGLDFALIASTVSEDPGSKGNGGDFGWVTRGDFVPEFDAVAFRVPIGEVSEVFESPFGYHICKIEKRRGEQYKGRHILLAFKVGSKQLIEAKGKLDKIGKEIEGKTITWEQAVLDHSDDDQTKGSRGILYNMSSGSMWWDMREIDPMLFKGIDDLEVGEISVPLIFETPKGKAYRIVKLMGRTDPHKANLKDDYQMIQSYALTEQQNKAMTNWVNSKLKNVYIRIDDQFQDLKFRYEWLPQ